jgi:hypothetical protein
MLRLIAVSMLMCIIRTQRVILEIGDNDPSNCDTIGNVIDTFKLYDPASDKYTPQFLVGGQTKSPSFMGGTTDKFP